MRVRKVVKEVRREVADEEGREGPWGGRGGGGGCGVGIGGLVGVRVNGVEVRHRMALGMGSHRGLEGRVTI